MLETENLAQRQASFLGHTNLLLTNLFYATKLVQFSNMITVILPVNC